MPSAPDPAATACFQASMADRLTVALWIYDFDAARIVWANESALRLWGAPDAAALAARDMAAEMSNSVRARLDQHREDFARDPLREIRELWTLYPDGRPLRVQAALRRHALADGRIAMLVEAAEVDLPEPLAVRSADALLHTRIMTALYAEGGAALYANPAFRAAFGPGARVFGAEFVTPDEAAAFRDGLRASGEHRATVQVVTVEGARWHDIFAVRCRDAVTGAGAFLISASDVTESRVQAIALRRARDAAEAADRAKSIFLATMSHELRTPLNGVLGMAGVLGRMALTPAQARALDMIRVSGSQMLDMIEDMLDVVALDAGDVRLTPAPFDVARAFEASIAPFRAEAERKGLSLALDLGGIGPDPLVHDARRIRQVLRHLLSNAVKFADRGEIFVSGRRDAAGALVIEVADSGPGVPEDQRAKIFERFHQIDGSTSRRFGGVGLGLSICRDLVRLWGGDIGVSDGLAGGARFWFTAPPLPGAQAACPPPQAGQPGRRAVSITLNSAQSAS